MSLPTEPQTTPPALPVNADREAVERLIAGRAQIETELAKVIVGQKEVIEQILIALFAGGHCLITGAPGLAKTLLVKSIAQIFHLKFQRIQFTPDLMPADITGTEILQDTGEGRKMLFVRGPVFANMILADEINRTPPKTQAALLEAMQEHQVTAAGVRHVLEEPFFVLATQNPIEMEGTYPLPEAQLDRFMFNVVMNYLPEDDEVAVVQQTTARRPAAIEPLFTGEDVLRFHELVRQVPIAENLIRYAVRLTAASRPQQTERAGVRERLGELGCRHARRAISRAWRQSPRAAARPLACFRRRHSRAGRAGSAPSHSCELPSGSRRHECGNNHPASAGNRERAGRVKMKCSVF